MGILFSLAAVVGLLLVAFLGAQIPKLEWLFGIVVPYIAIIMFLGGFVFRVVHWGKSPVPFRIPSTCGQQKSLSWIKSSKLDNPHTKLGVVGRMLLEVLLFRSLWRNTAAEVKEGGKVVQGSSKWLWIGAMAFHWCFLLVLLRHFRFFSEPVPECVTMLASLDGFLQIGAPPVQMTGVILFCAVAFLFLRRIYSPQLRYISLPADWFPLFLLMGIAGTGLLIRHVARADIVAVKELAMGLVALSPSIPDGVKGEINSLVYAHIFLVCVLLMYFPVSKLMHMGGVFLSPTRNMANNNRAVRHVNPWDYPVKVHTYEEYEDDFRDKMKAAGIPLDREPETAGKEE